MVEVPSAALTAEAILREVGFASLGTNDLTQYAMAADRQIFLRREDQIDGFVDVVLDRIKRHHTCLSNPGHEPTRDAYPAIVLRFDIELRARREDFAQARNLGHRIAGGLISLEIPGKSDFRYLRHDHGSAPRIGCVCSSHEGKSLLYGRGKVHDAFVSAVSS